MAAALAARQSALCTGVHCSITLLERQRSSGSKIRISGGGKCNVTHRGTPAELLEKGFLRSKERRFLRHALYAFSNAHLLALLRSRGVECSERADGKIFPVSGDALSVVAAFEGLLRDAAVKQHFSGRVRSVERKGELFIVNTEAASFSGDAVIIATGGVSYSHTGTTGDGLRIARSFGHTLNRLSPALAPLYTIKSPPSSLCGLSLRSIGFIATGGGMRLERQGDLLFTHRGFSGPAVLSLSRDIADLSSQSGQVVHLFADLFPGQRVEELEAHLFQQGRKRGSQMVRKFLQSCPLAPQGGNFALAAHGTIPTALIPLLMQQSALEVDVTWSTLGREKRLSLLAVLKAFPLGIVREVPLEQGEVSAGGVALNEINPKRMESRIVPNLFLCGELLDYAGEIGGFNLQAAFSTGWMAGNNALYPAQE